MKYSKILVLLYILILIFSIVYGVGYTPYAKNEYSVKIGDSQDSLFIIPVENYGYAPMLKKLIDGAKNSVHISMEILSDYNPVKTLLDALISAHDRNVDVRVIYEGDISSNSYGASYLSEHGVSVENDSSSVFLHTKMVVIDDRVVYVGSHNWSPYAQGKNNEYGILIFNTTIARFYDRYFSYLWNNPSSSPNLGEISENSNGIKIQTTYDGYTYQTLKNLISSSTHRLYVAVYTMAYYSNPKGNEYLVDDLVNEIVDKKNIAKVVLDNHDSKYAYNYLSSEGVSVRKDLSSTVTHLKLVIADDSVYVGDANWDYTYLDNETHTVGIVIHNSTIANFFANYFLEVNKYGDAPYYIPDAFVENGMISAEAGQTVKINFYLANGGYKNKSTFQINVNGPFESTVYPSSSIEWTRNSVYDWRNGTIRINIPQDSSGKYAIALQFLPQSGYINYTIYIVLNVQGVPIPEFNGSYISMLIILIAFLWEWKKKN